MFKFYDPTFVITFNNLFQFDCNQIKDIIEFMKRRIQLNLFLNEQIDQFFLKCQQFEFDF